MTETSVNGLLFGVELEVAEQEVTLTALVGCLVVCLFVGKTVARTSYCF